MTKGYVKLLALITTFLFTLNATVLAAPHKIYTIRVPEEIGQVKERYEGTSDEVVVHIQDAHTSFEAQQNLAKLIDHLVSSEGLTTVTTEAAEGYLDYSALRNLPGGAAKKDVLGYFLKQGRFTGTEYAQITSSTQFDLYGAESMELYDKNHEAFVSTISKREEILDQIEEVENILNSLKGPLYSEDVTEFDAEITAYRNGDLSFFEYCGKLLMFAGKSSIDISHYVNFTMLLEAKSWEDMIDFDKVDGERDAAIKAVKSSLSMKDDALAKKKREIFNRQLEAFTQAENKQGASSTQFYSLLKNLTIESRVDQEQVQNFMSFANYISIFSRLDKGGLLLECKELQRAIEERLASNTSEKELIHLTRNIQLLKEIVELKVVPEDVEYYRTNKDKFSAAVFKSFLENNGHPDAHVSLLDEILPAVDSFYTYAEERSSVMADDAVNRMNKANDDIVSLIAGGYHTEGITAELKAKGISYLVITPQINGMAADVPYMDQMMGAKMPFQMLIESAINTLMQKAKAMLPAELQDIIGLEVAKDTIVAIRKGDDVPQDVAAIMANDTLRDEWSKLTAAIYQHLANLGIDSYKWEDLVPVQPLSYKEKDVAVVRVESVNNAAPQYTVYYKDLTPPEVVSATTFAEVFKANVAAAAISQTSENDIVSASVNDLINARYQKTFEQIGIEKVDVASMSVEELVQALNPVLRKGDFGLMHVQGDTLPQKAAQKVDAVKKKSRTVSQTKVQSAVAPVTKVTVRVDQAATAEQETATVSALAAVSGVVQEIDTLVPEGVQVDIMPQSFQAALNDFGVEELEGRPFRYGDIVLYHEPATDTQPAIVSIGIDDFLAFAQNPEKTFDLVNRHTGVVEPVSNIELLKQAINHEVREAVDPVSASDDVQKREEDNRFVAPVADAGVVTEANRIARAVTSPVENLADELVDLYTDAVSNLVSLQESTFQSREAALPTSSVFALYLDADYIEMSKQYNEDELIRPLITSIEAASPQKIILGLEDEKMLANDFIKNLIAAVEKTNIPVATTAAAPSAVDKTEEFVSAVSAAEFTNKVVVTKNPDVISADVKGAKGEHVVKIDFNVMLDQSEVNVLPATFAAMNALIFLNKADDAEFKNTDLLVRDAARELEMPAAGYIYGFSDKVTDALAEQGVAGVFKVVSGLMKTISARVAEQRIYEKTIELAA